MTVIIENMITKIVKNGLKYSNPHKIVIIDIADDIICGKLCEIICLSVSVSFV